MLLYSICQFAEESSTITIINIFILLVGLKLFRICMLLGGLLPNVWKLQTCLLHLLNWILLNLLSHVGCKMLQSYLAWWLRTTNVCNLIWEPIRKQTVLLSWVREGKYMCLLLSVAWCCQCICMVILYSGMILSCFSSELNCCYLVDYS